MRTRWQSSRWLHLLLLLALLFDLAPVSATGPAAANIPTQVDAQVGSLAFNFVGWEAGAIIAKFGTWLLPAPEYLTEAERKQFVLDYLKLIDRINQSEAGIQRVYADPKVKDPAAATTQQRAELAGMRADQSRRQPLAEAILEQQISAVLADEGLGVLGQVLPPVQMHFTPLPQVLVISPRDHVESIYQISLVAGLPLESQVELENRVSRALNVSALIVPIGGMAMYPSMLLETGSLQFALESASHEWTHHYFGLFPVGLRYDADPQVRTINETAAIMTGRELMNEELKRYYPEVTSDIHRGQAAPAQDAQFNFNKEMHTTRVEADRLLAAGKIEEAEAYMEARRQVFVAHGYAIRKLNQAYFAFYGAYNDQPGAGGADPVGPAVVELRHRSPSLKVFLEEIRFVGSFADLQRLLGR